MMTPISRHVILAAVIIVLFLSGPVSAAQSLVSESFTPNPPLVAGSSQHAVIQYAIASGTTFPKNHELQMQTDLQHAQWTLQVILDGNNAARQTVSGSTAFLSGELLSYSVNHDVRFTVTIDGAVPAAASGTVTVLDLVEIDNTGSIVPGSESVISQPVAGAGSPGAVTSPAVPTLTPPLVTTTPSAKSPGFSFVPCCAGIGLALCLCRLRRRHYLREIS
jgi:hypothetical protein